MRLFLVCVIFLLSGVFSGDCAKKSSTSKCSGCPLMYKGKFCASTTRYFDTTKGACGCGKDGSSEGWSKEDYTAAINSMMFDNTWSTWCGKGCGGCFRLTATGGYVQYEGKPAQEGQSIIVMATNDCPKQGNEKWCGQNKTPTQCQQVSEGECNQNSNQYGYSAHFDLQDLHHQISGMGWDNPEVTMELVACPENVPKTPTPEDWTKCTECYKPDYFCNGYSPSDSDVCSGHGKCVAMNICDCADGFSGSLCQNKNSTIF